MDAFETNCSPLFRNTYVRDDYESKIGILFHRTGEKIVNLIEKYQIEMSFAERRLEKRLDVL